MWHPRSILITGASAGLGAALARAYARPGATLFLLARRRDALEAVARAVREKGAEAHVQPVDVTDRDAMARAVAWAEAARPLDLVIANAGISAGTGAGAETEEQARDIFTVNMAGVLNTVYPALPGMRRRGSGHIAIMSSLAGRRGFPGAPAYCGSKAAVKVWGEGLRGHLAADGVGVSVILPGFVETPMTAVNDFPMPFLWPADRAARHIRRRIARNRARIAFPWPLAALTWLVACLPPGPVDRLLARLPGKS